MNTTRNKESFGQGDYFSVNMGGIVGDTTEGTDASALLYDVYNKGQIGDETFNYYARHVGGIVGRLSGTVEKAYNTGAIYNGYNVVGGIAGWMYKGSITNAFNTGNITVVNNENGKAGIQAGGIVGGATTGSVKISNVYNLGTIRGFQESGWGSGLAVGGIVGAFIGDGRQSISNAYTTGNLYISTNGTSTNHGLGSMYGTNGEYTQGITTSKTYYIRPDKDSNLPFVDLVDYGGNNAEEAILFSEKDNIGEYDFDGGITNPLPGSNGANVDEGSAWRIYDGTTPILNAFLPNAEDYFSGESGQNPSLEGIGSIQYGTAYDPLLTIVNAAKGTSNLEFNWQDLKINNDAGLAVYGAGLTLKDFMSTGGSGYFGGLIYSDGALNINAYKAENPNITGDVALGSASQLYGSSVAINADGQVTIYGSVTATGNVQDGTSWSKDEHKYTGKIAPTDGSVSISGGSVDIYGQLTSADGQPVKVPGINGMAAGWSPETDGTSVSDPKDAMSDIGDRFGYTTQPSDTPTQTPGNISITAVANDAEDGHVNVYYGNKGEGIVTTGGDLEVTASGDVYMDSDLSIGGNLTLNASNDSEAVLDISNIGKVQAANGIVTDALTGLHAFLDHFAQEGKNITLKGDETKLAVDMWGDGAFDLTKYDLPGEDEDTLAYKLDQLHINGETGKGKHYTYIWVSTGEQLAGIQDYKDKHQDSNILSYNFALKNDIDASNVTDYKAIGSGEGNEYTGTFDGRDNRIIGLDTTKTSNGSSQTLTNAGIFDTIGADGTVEDLRVYSGTFHGTNNAGAVAGVNKRNISNVTAFGNVVTAQGSGSSTLLPPLVEGESDVHVGAAGGITGVNAGKIDNASAIGTATAADGNDALSTAGGIAGINQAGAEISDSTSNSAVNASAESTYALGGVTGVNAGKLNNVDSLGVTTGLYKLEGHNSTKENQYSDNVGGVAGINQAGGTVESAYNESITNGRNNGEITGNNHVGGLVGNNGVNSTLTNLTNDSAAAITGDNYVGGIAGSNAGKITASSVDEEGHVIEGNDNLINRGTITGVQYVGGVAGENTGTITNTNNDVDLHVKEGATDAKYFGGVAGINGSKDGLKEGTIENATNSATIIAENADYVGGIVGWNTSKGVLQGMGNSNEGNVTGNNYVGGVAGKNDAAVGSASGQVVITNSGKVTANGGGAGGIFGVNDGVISNAHLTNEGNVTGTTTNKEGDETGTGGIFGINHKNITDSILENLTGNVTINTEAGQIVQNVGGLIGINTGDVSTSSLKNEANITVTAGDGQTVENIGGLIGQNTGDITGGRTDAEGNDVGYYKYQIYNNGTITVEGTGTNIGGLIGTNEAGATVIAGYNTGVIHASGSENVGGIAGTNTGELNQVFNTVINVNEDGSTAPGSITGHANVGGIAGTNSDTGTISNAYNTSDVYGVADSTGSIAGTNSNATDDSISNVYSTITGSLVGGTNTTVTNGYNTTTEGDWTKHDSYGGFDFTGSEDNAAVWKIYEGSTNPLLKVFLTQLTVHETNEAGENLDNYLNLVYNGKEQDINIQDLIANGFITGPDGMTYEDKDGNDISFAFDAYNNTKLDGENSLGNSSLLKNTEGQKFADEYNNWLTSDQISAGKGTVNNLGYDIDLGTRKVNKAQISISLDEIHRTYGDSTINNMTAGTKDYGFTISNMDADAGLTDVMESELAGIKFTEGSIKDGAVTITNSKQDQVTNDAGDYYWGATFDLGEDTSKESLAHNYEFVSNEQGVSEITVGGGISKVVKAGLTINAGSDTIYVGVTPQFSGTANAFVNGDSFQLDFGMSAGNANLSQTAGTYDGVVGFWYNGTFYGTQAAVDGATDLFGGNYKVTFKPGTLTVQDLPEGMPDISDIPSIERHWNFLFDDNPWDRNRDFRERKAEVHFVAGGMTL